MCEQSRRHRATSLLGTLVPFFVATSLLAADDPRLAVIGELEAAPTLDGSIGDVEWAGAAVLDQPFVQMEPAYGEPSRFDNRVHVGRTATALYVAFEAFDDEIERLSAAVTARDQGLSNDDALFVLLDTFDDGRTAYFFGCNVLSTQQDGRIADNGRTVDFRWDEAWRCAARRFEDRWILELEIPFSILRYSPAATAAGASTSSAPCRDDWSSRAGRGRRNRRPGSRPSAVSRASIWRGSARSLGSSSRMPSVC